METAFGGWFGGVAAALFGLCVGSYSNVVIYRSPLDGISSFRPKRSFCPGCNRQLTWSENIPVFSWLLQRGRCRGCQGGISFRYPAVELAVAGLFLLSWWLSPPVDMVSAVTFVVLAYITTTCLIVTLIDIDHLIIPDTITLPGIALGLGVSLAFPFLHEGHVMFRPDGPHLSSLLAAGAGALAGGGSLWLVGKIGALFLKKAMEEAGVEDAMGFGDVKWMAHMGTFLGLWGALGAIIQACFLGAGIGIVMKVVASLRGRGEAQPIPFGPFLSAGVVVELVVPGITWEWLQFLGGQG